MELKNKLTVIAFFITIIGIGLLNILIEDNELSTTERRRLLQFSSVTLENMNTKLDEYISDQFIFRDTFKLIKTYFEFDVLQKQDNNDLFIYNGGIVKSEEINESSIIRLTDKINEITDTYLEGMNVYYTIVPDKQNYVEKSSKYNTFDFEELEKIVEVNIGKTNEETPVYIDIFDIIGYDMYYKTDSHWRQEYLLPVANKIGNVMNVGEIDDTFEVNIIEDFTGVYYGQLQYNVEKEKLIYLTNETINNSVVYNYETNKESGVYDETKVGSLDEYELFLSGAAAFQEITNENAQTDKELIIFRDSFGSSLTPLLIEKYSKITLVDLRYMSSKLLDTFIEFRNQDVLFMYSTMLFNNSGTIK